VPLKAPEPVEIERFLVDGDCVRAGKVEAGVIHTPGHTPGSLCFSVAGATPLLIAGDTLFQGGIGRTDLWGGSANELLGSIRKKLLTLPDETLVIAGHGPTTTIGRERRMNPYLG
ncbi:MAG: MBL fold metallo-hydrolase, partial [Polyangiaceae bacterium]|nr:MBL fold metallo-hydrolase [Polyangiaceae bacterium]